MLVPSPAFAPAIIAAVLSLPTLAQAPYRSAMEGYLPFTEQEIAPWTRSNDTVREVGGWRAYAREARPTAVPASAASAPSAPASAPHTNAKP
jgi:hypothetical protein